MTVEDELAIRRTLAAYCHHLDQGDFEGVVEQFAAEGSLAFGTQVATGPNALARFFEDSQPPHRRGKHVSANAIVDVDGDRASVVSDFVFLRWIKSVLTVEATGGYRDTFVRVAGRWRIERREIEMMAPPSN